MMSFKDFKRSKDNQTLTTNYDINFKSTSMNYYKKSNDKVAGPLQTKSNLPILDQKGTTILEKTKETKETENDQSSLSSAASTSSVTSSKSTVSSSSSPSSSSEQHSQMKMSKLFGFVGETYRYIRRCNSGLNKDLYNTNFIETINKYRNGCNKIYEDAFQSYEISFKLAQNIIRTMDFFKEMCTTYTNMEEYQHRICELMAIFITCELRLSVDATVEEQHLIGNRIVYIMRKHLVQEEEDETRYNILRTLVYIPRLFNAREVMCFIFGEFIPLKPVLKINVLTDKLYMLYIIVFYRWMKMQKDTDDTQIIINFAENFMKPSVTLCANKLYATHLPRYTTHSSATRTILNNMKFYKDIRNASIIDNALKKTGTVVNLCDDEDDDVIIEDTCGNIDFAEIFASVQLESLVDGGKLAKIKLEETTVVDSVDLTLEEDVSNISSTATVRERHQKWLNSFYQLAQQYRESQILLQKQNSIQSAEAEKVICLDSDSECTGDEEVTTQKEKETVNNNKPTASSEDLFIDNYPLTNTPINCESDLGTSDEEDADDVTKLSSRFLPGTLRTYQAKSREKDTSNEKDLTSPTTESNRRTTESADINIDMAYRRDSIHITSTPPCRGGNDDDDGTDVQDEHEDDNEDDSEEEQYRFLLKPTPKKTSKDIFVKEIKPMGPYPTYNNLSAEKIIFSQSSIPFHKQQNQQQQQQQQQYLSDSSETTLKKSEQQKKRVHFNTSPLGPTSAYSSGQKYKLKPSLLQQKLQQQQHHNYKVSDAPDFFQHGAFDRFSYAPSITDSTSTAASTSTSSSLKQQQQRQHQERIAAAATLFRNIFDRPRHDRTPFSYTPAFSPSSSSSRSLTSPATEIETKPRYLKNTKSSLKLRRATICSRDFFHKEQPSDDESSNSHIRNREAFNCLGPPGVPCSSFRDGKSIIASCDDFDAVSDSDAIRNGRYKDDDKLRKRCAVVITPTKEILQYERKRDEMYNEILLKQRKTLELRAIEKQREKDKRRLERDGKREPIKWNDKGGAALPKRSAIERDKHLREYRNYNDICLSSESDIETHSQFRTRKQKQKQQKTQKQHHQQHIKELQPLSVQTEMTKVTNSLLNEIDAHLDEPESSGEHKNHKVEQVKVKKQSERNDKCGKSTKMRELNLLVDIAQPLSPPYPSELQSNSEIQTTSSKTDEMNVTPVTLVNETATVNNILEKQLDVSKKAPTTSSEQECPEEGHVSPATAAAELPTSLGPLFETEDHQHQKQNNNPNEICENSREEALEQILEESLNVLKSVTSPPESECTLKNSNDDTQTKKPKTESIIPLLISSVESLNHMELNIDRDESIPESPTKQTPKRVKKKKSLNNTVFIAENCLPNNTNIAKELENYEMESNKALSKAVDSHLNNNAILLSSTLMESDLNATDICEHEITNNLRPSSLMPTDISDISDSLESEISKHLPDIAEPSPIVTTDMSENSMESEMSKSLSENTDNPAVDMADLTLPALPLVLPSIPSTTQAEVDNNYNINATLNTPTKIQLVSIMDTITLQSTDSLNTPIKIGIEPVLETTMENGLEDVLEEPMKNGLEPESDTNVTKFLDLILNKTVTDAESETRDKILKELNAITADISTASSLEDTDETVAVDKENKSTDSCPQVISEINSVVVDTETVLTVNEHNLSDSGAEVVSEINSVETVPEIIESKSVDSVATVIEIKSLKLDLNSLDFENKSVDAIDNEALANASLDSINVGEANKSLDSSNLLTTEENIHLDDATATVIVHNSSNSYSSKQYDDIPENLTVTAINSRTSAELIQSNAEACDILSDSEKNLLKIPLQDYHYTQATPAAPMNGDDSELSPCINLPSVPIKLKSPTRRTFNIKCRVRLKRLNVARHCKTKVNETWVALPLKNPEEEETAAANNDEISNCDNENETATTTSSLIKKPCLKINNNKLTRENIEEININKSTEAEDEKLLENVPTPTIIEKPLLVNTLPISTKSKSKTLKSVTFDLSNIQEGQMNSTSSKYKQKSKGFYMKTHKHPRKLPENTLRAAETLQIFVNTINDSIQTPPPAELNKKRSPIKNKCIAEDETPIPPLASPLLEVAHKKTDKSKSPSLTTAAMPSRICSELTTGRIYTSSPLDQSLPKYDDNVDTVADPGLILPTTTDMSRVRRKSKKAKKSLTRHESVYDTSTDDTINQKPSVCNGVEDTDNEVDVFTEELLPIPATNEHILEEIVTAQTPHIVTGTGIREDYMNIEATDTVPVNLFNDESRDLATPELRQSTGETNVVDSSSFLKKSPLVTGNSATEAATKMGNLDMSMLSPSEHEVSSTQESFFQTPIKNKQNGDASGDKDKMNSLTAQQQSLEDTNTKTKEDKTSSAGLLQNNQVDTTNHSPEMCTLTLTTTSPSSSSSSSSANRKMRKASTHDEILFSELQQLHQKPLQQQQKRKTATTTYFAESTSDNKKMKVISEETKTNGSFGKSEDTIKKIGVEVDIKTEGIESIGFVGSAGGGGGGGGSSPSTTTTINEENISRAKRKKMKSSIKKKQKSLTTTTSYSPHIPANPLIITIPKSGIVKLPQTPSPIYISDQPAEPPTTLKFYNNETHKEEENHHHNNHHSLKRDKHAGKKSKRSNSPENLVQKILEPEDIKQFVNPKHELSNATYNSQETQNGAALIDASPPTTSLSLTIPMKKKVKRSNSPENVVQKVLEPEDIKLFVIPKHQSSNATYNTEEMQNAAALIATVSSKTSSSLTIPTKKKGKHSNSPENVVQKVIASDNIKQLVNPESSNVTCNSQEMQNTATLITALPSTTSLSLTIPAKKKGRPLNSKSNDNAKSFVRDKYDVVKNNEIQQKHPEYLNKVKERGLKTNEKNDNPTKLSNKRKKEKEKNISSANVLKLITPSSCNKTMTPTSNNTFTNNLSSLSSFSASSLSPINNKQASSKSTKNSPDINSSNSNYNTKLKSLSTMPTSTTTVPSLAKSSSMTTVSTSNVKKKLKTK